MTPQGRGFSARANRGSIPPSPIGVGFGLQSIIQNFVAGLILIFGRPINVEDTIQLGELVGTVRRIGFRASVVRSFLGAEVIGSNAELISNQVVNWTPSDSHRRIDLDIGVAYGSGPEQVLTLLFEVATTHEEVLAEPAPEALFDLTVAIHCALAAANIGIPFPQRDLHLRSIDPDAARLLN